MVKIKPYIDNGSILIRYNRSVELLNDSFWNTNNILKLFLKHFSNWYSCYNNGVQSKTIL